MSGYNICKEAAQTVGGVVDLGGTYCFLVYGKKIEIESDKLSVQQGFEICNFNFHANGTLPPLPSPEFEPGPVEGYFSGV